MKHLKFLVALLIIILSAGVLSSQSTQVNWGPVYKNKGSFSQYKFLGLFGNKYYVVSKPITDNIIIGFDMYHQIISEEKFEYAQNNQRLSIDGVVQTKSGIYLYSHQVSLKHKEWILYSSEIVDGYSSHPREAAFLELDLEKKQITEGFSQFINYNSFSDGGLVISKDSSKVAFVNFVQRTNFNKDDAICIAVFNDKMELLWKDIFYYKFGEKRGDIEKTLVTNEGEIYLVGYVERENNLNSEVKSTKEKNLPSYDYMIYNINSEGILSHRIDLGQDVAPVEAGVFFPINSTGEYLISGFYTNDEYGANRVNGVFFGKGNKEFTKHDIKIHPFENSFLENLASESEIKKGKGIDTKFKIKDLLEYKDGTIAFVAEETEILTQYFNNYNTGFSPFRSSNNYGLNNNTQQRITYRTHDLIIPKFDVEGNLLNIQKIEKDFSSENPFNTSYSLAINRDKTYFVFNDNKNRKERKAIDKKGNLFTDIVVLDENGVLASRETIFSNKEIDLEFTTYFNGYNAFEMLIGSMVNNRYSLGTINFSQF